MKQVDDWGFYLIIGGMVAIMVVLVLTNSLPEKAAADFNVLTDVSIPTNYRVLQQPTPDANVFVYSVNDVAAKAIPIAEEDWRVREIIDKAQVDYAAVSIGAIQPTVYESRSNGNLAHSNAGVLSITVNQQTLDNQPYLQAYSFDKLQGKKLASSQQVWAVMVDLDKRIVTDIQESSDRLAIETLESNTINISTNMFMADAVKIQAGTSLKWLNTSDLPHNIMGVYNTASGEKIPIDSGFMQKGESWKYTFDEAGTFDYHCSTHSGDGMKGSVVVTGSNTE